jgi:hypothetical protein
MMTTTEASDTYLQPERPGTSSERRPTNGRAAERIEIVAQPAPAQVTNDDDTNE